MLCHSFMERFLCLHNVQICAVMDALNIINNITLFMPEFLRCYLDIRNYDVVTSCSFLSALDL